MGKSNENSFIHELAELRRQNAELNVIIEDLRREVRLSEQHLKQCKIRYSLLSGKYANPAFLSKLPGDLILEVNDAFIGEFGISKEETYGKTGNDLSIFSFWESRMAVIQELETSDSVQPVEFVLFSKSGEKNFYEANIDRVSIDHEEYLVTTIQNITGYKQAILKLEENYELLKIAGEKAKLGGWNVILDENRVYWSDEVAAIHEMPPGYHPLVEDGISFYAPEWREKITEIFNNCVQKGLPYDEELQIITSSGKRVWVRTIGEPVRDQNGAIFKIQGAFQDITLKKLKEEQLEESQSRYRAIFESTGTATLIVNADTSILLANKECFSMFGYDPANLIGQKWTQFVAPESIQEMLKNHNLRRNSPDLAPMKYEVVLLDSGGQKRYVDLTVNMIPGTGQSVVSMLDISERKLAEKELEENKNQLEEYFENDISADYVVSVTGEIFSCNQTFLSLFGFENKSGTDKFDITNLYKNPEDRQEIIRLIQRKKRLENYEVEFVSKEGKTIKALVNAIGIFDHRNKLTRIRGYIVDITELKEVQKKLGESEERYRRFFEDDITGDFHTTVEGRILLCNDAYARILKYDSKEQIYAIKATDVYFDNSHRAEFLDRLKAERKLQNVELTLKARDGSRVEIIENAVGIFDESDELVEIIGYMSDITKEKRAREELLKSEEKYRFLFAHNPQPMWIYDLETLAFLEVNRSAESHYGYSREEFLQMTLKDIRPEEDVPLLLDDVKNTKNDLSSAGEWRHIKKNGEIIYVEIVSHSVDFNNRKARHVLVNDVTRRKFFERELLKLSRTVEQNPVSVIITDLEGNIEYINPKTVELTGYSRKELMGQNPRILSSGEKTKDDYKALWDSISSGKQWSGEFHNKKKDGSLYWEQALISPVLDEHGGIINYVAVKEDITERKKILEDLKLAKEQAEENDRLKSAFLANMSHEIRTPMNGILGFTELLLDPDLTSDEVDNYVHIVQKSGQRLLNTVNDIMEISKIEAGMVNIVEGEMDVHERVEEIISFFRKEAETKGLSLILDNSSQIFGGIIHIDQNKFDSIIMNLIKNAIKYTSVGSIHVGWVLKNSLLEFYVKDTGIGIAQSRIDSVFDRFVQSDPNTKKVYEGSGLGLTIAKSYVEMMGGKIWVESQEGIGSTFYFTISLCRSSA